MFPTILNKASFNVINRCRRCFSAACELQEKLIKGRSRAWQVHSYGDDLQCTETRLPHLQSPDELLINVEAASVNPIDLLMLGGYGKTLFQIPRMFEMELPLTLGRDFCGTVINKGHGVGDCLSIGDQVYGFIPIHKQGSFAEVIVADKSHVCRQPKHLNTVESASLVYATMTAWSALYLFANSGCKITKGTRVLILGASGGVGTAATQLLKSQDCIVYGTCATDAVPLVQSMGADCVFDYKDKTYLQDIADAGYYHIIVDCAKFGFENIPKTWQFDTYVGLNSPLLSNTDKYGLIGGFAASASSLLSHNLQGLSDKRTCKWGFFTPSSCGFKFINDLITQRKICPVIHKEFMFENMPEAFQEVKNGHLRGKVVINYN